MSEPQLVTDEMLRAIGADPAEIERLQQLSRELAAASASPWEPACIARAFATSGRGRVLFTMQVWIDLSAARSPLLCGELPGTAEEVTAALAAFDVPEAERTPAEVLELAAEMRAEIARGFALRLDMVQPGAAASTPRDDGFGAWLPIYSALIAQCHLSRADARACEVGEAFALLAAERSNRGWLPKGQPYAWRASEEVRP